MQTFIRTLYDFKAMQQRFPPQVSPELSNSVEHSALKGNHKPFYSRYDILDIPNETEGECDLVLFIICVGSSFRSGTPRGGFSQFMSIAYGTMLRTSAAVLIDVLSSSIINNFYFVPIICFQLNCKYKTATLIDISVCSLCPQLKSSFTQMSKVSPTYQHKQSCRWLIICNYQV